MELLPETGVQQYGYISAMDFEDSETVDITEEFLNLTRSLSPGKLVMASNFSLIDAMSAVELMDPKMDLGIRPVDQTLGLEYAIKHKGLNNKTFSTEELIAIYDASFAALASSIDGACFDQTIYTNICIHHPELIYDSMLELISKSFLRLTRTCRYLIELAGVAFEEDYNFQCVRDQQQIKTGNLDLIKELKDVYQEMIKSKPASDSSLHALSLRVKLLYLFFESLHYMVASPEVMAIDSTLTFEVNFKVAHTSMESLLKTFEGVRNSISLGTQPPEGFVDDGTYSWLEVFQPHVNRHLFGASFPKEAKIFTREAGYDYLGRMFAYLHRFTFELPENVKFVENLLSYVRGISTEGADVFSRSILGLMTFPFNDQIFGKTPVSELITNSMQVSVAPYIINKDYSFSPEVLDQWHIFLKDISTFFVDVIQALGMNLARQREKIGNYMEEATNVYYKAEAFDKIVAEYLYTKPNHRDALRKKPFPVSTFFANHFMELMSYHVELGFKLELFVDHELPYVYFYLGEVISLWRHRFWTKAKEYLDLERTLKPPDMPQKKFEKKKFQRELTINKNIVEIEKSMLQVRLQAAFCEMYFSLSAARVCSGNMIIPDNEQMRYACRFEAFRHVPSFASYSYVKYIVESQFPKFTQLTPAECYKKAFDAAHLSAEILNMLMQIYPRNASMKAESDLAKRNKIACSLLASKPEIFDSLDFKKNYIYPLIVVKNLKKTS